MTAEVTAELFDQDDLASVVQAYPYIDAVGEAHMHDVSWEEQVSEAGAGRFTLQNDLVQPTLGQLVTFSVKGTPAWTMLLEEFERRAVDPNEEGGESTTWSGRGHLALFESALIYPTFGLTAFPKQTDMHYDYRHPDYDDSAWVSATEIVKVDEAKAVPDSPVGCVGTSPWPIPWTENMPGGFPINCGTTRIIWDSSGSETSAPVGRVYFRKEFFTTWDGTYNCYFTADNSGEIYIDGCLLGAAGGPGSIAEAGFTTTGDITLHMHLTPGRHVLSGFGDNWFPYGGSTSPGGIAFAVYIPGYPPTLVAESDSSTLVLGYPSEPPGMTVGNAIRLAVEVAQSYGEIGDITLGFSDSLDTDGNPWAVDGDDTVLPTISTKVLTDLLTFLREVSATYCDVRMDPESFELRAWNYGAMNAGSSGESFLPQTTAVGLTQRGTDRRVNAVIGEYQGGYLEVASGATPRKAAQFQVGADDTPEEAYRVLSQALDDFQTPREEIQVVTDGTIAYVDYDLGQTASTKSSTGATVTRRIVAAAVNLDDEVGLVRTTPTLGDLFL